MTILDDVKKGMAITINDYDDALTMLINAAIGDLGIAGIDVESSTTDDLLKMAIITYCRIHLGTPQDFDRLVVSYNEQKGQLQTASGYGLPADESEGG